VVPGTLNYDEPDPDCPVQVPTGGPRRLRTPFVVKTGFTEMGQCGAVVVRKWD
jgi:3-oxoacyl-[acyl-carrier-protein] synthase II